MPKSLKNVSQKKVHEILICFSYTQNYSRLFFHTPTPNNLGPAPTSLTKKFSLEAFLYIECKGGVSIAQKVLVSNDI